MRQLVAEDTDPEADWDEEWQPEPEPEAEEPQEPEGQETEPEPANDEAPRARDPGAADCAVPVRAPTADASTRLAGGCPGRRAGSPGRSRGPGPRPRRRRAATGAPRERGAAPHRRRRAGRSRAHSRRPTTGSGRSRKLGDPVEPLVIDDFVTEPANDPVIGPELAAARTRVGLSVDELADRTRIRPHVIESIEVDDFVPCGGDFYARGHLRTLARVLGTRPRAAGGDVRQPLRHRTDQRSPGVRGRDGHRRASQHATCRRRPELGAAHRGRARAW